MPSVSSGPATLALAGGEATFIPARFSAEAAELTLTAGTTFAAPGKSAELNLGRQARLQRMFKIVDERGHPDQAFQRHWQGAMEAIEAAVNNLNRQVTDIRTTLEIAQGADDKAQTVSTRTAISESYVTPANILTAANDGSITIAAHTRVYGDDSSVEVDGGSLSGYSSGEYVTVYYVDAGRSGGAVTYAGTISAVAQKGDTHVVGQITIPDATSPPVTSTGTSASGYTPPSSNEVYDPNYIEP